MGQELYPRNLFAGRAEVWLKKQYVSNSSPSTLAVPSRPQRVVMPKKTKTDEIKDSMVTAYLEPIVRRLSERAREEVIETLCRPHCGKAPSRTFCLVARTVYIGFLHKLIQRSPN